MVYDWSWWLWSPFQTIVPWVHGPLPSHWTATVDPMEINAKTGQASLFVSFLCCLCTNLLWCSLSVSPPTGFLSMTGITLYTRWLNSNVAWLSKPYPSGVVWICNNAMWMSPPESHISKSAFNELNAGFDLHITLVMIHWWHCLLDVKPAAELSELVWNKIGASIWHYFMWYPIFCK